MSAKSEYATYRLSLSPECDQNIKEMAERLGLTIGDVLRSAIALFELVSKAKEKHQNILIRILDSDDNVIEEIAYRSSIHSRQRLGNYEYFNYTPNCEN